MHRGGLFIPGRLGPAGCGELSGLVVPGEGGGWQHPRSLLLHPCSRSLLGGFARTVALVTRPDYFSFCLFLGKGLRGISFLEKELRG